MSNSITLKNYYLSRRGHYFRCLWLSRLSKGHIKGSYAVDLNKDLTGPLRAYGRHPLPG